MKIKTIALVAPSGNIRSLDEINAQIAILESKFKVKKFYDEQVSLGYLSDTDENRVKYFESAFLDDEVDLVLSIRGGYGAIRIVDKINYDLIKGSRACYTGSSDATILLASLSARTNIKCFHGLMVTNGFVENLDENIGIIENWIATPTSWLAMTYRKDNCVYSLSLRAYAKQSRKENNASGKLWGGNLSSLVSLLSNEKYLPNEDIILFLEDLNEPLYKIDKMFYEIYRSPLRAKIKGIIFGDFYLEDSEIMPLLKEYGEKFNVPTRLDKNITHKMNNVTLPYNQMILI